MKSCKVLKLLNVTRPTLCRYVKNGTLKVRKLPSGLYDYDEESVYKFLDKGLERKSVIYCRVSTTKQKKDLENQKNAVESYCLKNGINISDVYSDICSGINFDRKEFQRLVNDVVNHRVSKVYVTSKNIICRISFNFIRNLFSEFDCEIISLNDDPEITLHNQEVLNDIISLVG